MNPRFDRRTKESIERRNLWPTDAVGIERSNPVEPDTERRFGARDLVGPLCNPEMEDPHYALPEVRLV